MRTSSSHNINSPKRFKTKLLAWAQQFQEVAWFDSNTYQFSSVKYDAVLAVDAFTALKTDFAQGFDKLQEYQETTADWIFGYLTYDLKNDLERLTSSNYDGLDFPDLYFFQPKKIFLLKGDQLEMHYLGMVDDEVEADLEAIESFSIPEKASVEKMNIQARISKEDYLEKAEEMLAHIHRGDIYEANFCQEFYAEEVNLNPFQVYQKLNELSHPPFATFLKLEEFHLFSASPERYIQKTGNKLISQPIKGTAKRLENLEVDNRLKQELQNDPKERAENVMIVDLVRNDLSRTATKGSVKVEELCGLYTFEQVHQLISTISSEVNPDLPLVEILRTTFPMGSMTGAPKISAMKIIEELEETKRGLYSGSVGYFAPNGDFDFNVIIRSILYNSEKKYASFSVGSAITAKSNSEKEYEECLVKAKAMRKALEIA